MGEMNILQKAEAIKSGEITAAENIENQLNRIEEINEGHKCLHRSKS